MTPQMAAGKHMLFTGCLFSDTSKKLVNGNLFSLKETILIFDTYVHSFFSRSKSFIDGI